ncbi:MAG: hypothetical protein ACFFAO_07870 [Candidatus Hermodarchaeota archaeon]
MVEKELIFTISGIRGIVGKNLNAELVKRIALAYGLWLKSDDKTVIIGRDTRPSGQILETAIIEGLTYANCEVIDLGVCPTPIIIYMKNQLHVPGGIIISGSHNPPEWNGLKLLSTKTYLNKSEVEEISNFLYNNRLDQYYQKVPHQPKVTENLIACDEYIQGLRSILNIEKIGSNNNLRVALDTGAGAGKVATPKILKLLGCEIKLVNNDFINSNKFPREIEPIEKNLKDLTKTVLEEGCVVGFAHDCDADRIAIIGDDGTCYTEDVGLALIADYIFNQFSRADKKVIFVTNLASSLMFEALAEKYNMQVLRTPVGERFLAEKMENLLKEVDSSSIVFGGEGSCGGVMIPQFNNTRDGIFAAAKIVEILVETNKKISSLVSKLPKFYAFREYINTEGRDLEKIINQLRIDLISDGENVDRIDMDLRFGKGNEWFALIHPSNTEPLIRIIIEANNENFARQKLKSIIIRVKSSFTHEK